MKVLWWQDPCNYISTLESDEDEGIKELYGRETESGWEYAVLFVSFGRRQIIYRFKNGKMLG